MNKCRCCEIIQVKDPMDRMSHEETVSPKMSRKKLELCRLIADKEKKLLLLLSHEKEKVSLGLTEIECHHQNAYLESAGAVVCLRSTLGILSTLS